jgi:hypothetical protein
VNALSDFKPVQRFQNRSYVITFWSICDSATSGVKNKLKTIKLICGKVEKNGVTIVQLRMDESGSNIASSGLVTTRFKTSMSLK